MNKDYTKEINRVIKYVVTIIFIIIFIAILLFNYQDFQKSIFSIDDDLILISNIYNVIYTILFMGALPYGILFFIQYINYYSQYNISINYKSYKVLFIAVFFVISGYMFQLFNYDLINQNGIEIRNNLFSSERHYSFSNIKRINIYCDYGQSKNTRYTAYLYYEIILDNKKIINLKNSNDFWDKILLIDKLFIEKGVQIDRITPDKRTYMDTLAHYLDADIQTISKHEIILKKILNAKYDYLFNYEEVK